MGDEYDVDLRPYTVTDFEPVGNLTMRINRELAPAGMETLFERYIATTMRESFRLLEIFSQARAAGVSANFIRGPNLLFCAILEQYDRKGVEERDARQWPMHALRLSIQ
jgi:hypothetical protein